MNGFMGFKKASELIMISGRVSETAANTFTQLEVSLDLDPISREIFVVTDCVLDPDVPNTVAAQTTLTAASLSTTSRTSVGGIGNSEVIQHVIDRVFGGAAEFNFARTAMPNELNTTGTTRDYLAIISTSNFFAQIEGQNNTAARGASFRVSGYRAKADADTYAALVASEVLSS
jgi:hypothetical protein